MAEEIEMDKLDPDAKVDDNDDDDVIETSISHIKNDDDIRRLIQRKHSLDKYDTVIEKITDKLPKHFKAENRNYADAAVESLGENELLKVYPDAGDLRHKPVEIGVIKTGPAKGRIGVRIYGEKDEFTPILNKKLTVNRKLRKILKDNLEPNIF